MSQTQSVTSALSQRSCFVQQRMCGKCTVSFDGVFMRYPTPPLARAVWLLSNRHQRELQNISSTTMEQKVHSMPLELLGPDVFASMWSLLVASHSILFAPMYFCLTSKARIAARSGRQCFKFTCQSSHIRLQLVAARQTSPFHLVSRSHQPAANDVTASAAKHGAAFCCFVWSRSNRTHRSPSRTPPPHQSN